MKTLDALDALERSGSTSTMEGVTLDNSGRKFLLKNSKVSAENGVYTVQNGAWERVT